MAIFQQIYTEVKKIPRGQTATYGEIVSFEDKKLTVKLTDNSSKIILVTDATVINKAAEGVKEDLRTGEKIALFGVENSDGSLTAQSIQLNPIRRERGPGGGL